MTKHDLTQKQRLGVVAMLTAPTVAAAAAQAKVTERTFYRWLAMPAFTTALRTAQAGIIDAASRRLLRGLDQALDTLAELMTDTHGENVRRSAAAEWFDQCLTIHETSDLERRLTELERQVKG